MNIILPLHTILTLLRPYTAHRLRMFFKEYNKFMIITLICVSFFVYYGQIISIATVPPLEVVFTRWKWRSAYFNEIELCVILFNRFGVITSVFESGVSPTSSLNQVKRKKPTS